MHDRMFCRPHDARPRKPSSIEQAVRIAPRVGGMFGKLLLEDDLDRLRDLLVWIGLAIYNDFVLYRMGAVIFEHVLVGSAIVPTT